MTHMRDNLVRVRPDPEAAAVRAESDDDSSAVLHGHFSVFDTWYEVNSVWEGHFMERTVAGAFSDTLRNRGDRIKAQFEHGKDPFVGHSTLGTFASLKEDERGGYYALDLIDTDYNRDRIIPQARAGLLGASFRFSVPDGGDSWNDNPERSANNPDGLPERTIHEAEVYELGPVIFGASPAATAAMRSGTDDFIERLLNDPLFLARFAERVGAPVVENILSSIPAPDGPHKEDDTPDAGSPATSGSNNNADTRLRLKEWASRLPQEAA